MVGPGSSWRPLNRKRDLVQGLTISVLSVWGPRRRDGDWPYLVHDGGDEVHLVPELRCALASLVPEDWGISLPVQGCYLCPMSFAHLMKPSCLRGPMWEAAQRLYDHIDPIRILGLRLNFISIHPFFSSYYKRI